MMVSERDIESYLTLKIRQSGGLAWKFTSPGTRGVPDRWCVLAGHQFFVETKRPQAKKRADEKLQEHRAKQLTEQGCTCYKISTKDQVDRLIREITAGCLPKPDQIGAV